MEALIAIFSLLINGRLSAQSVPSFCETSHFDGIWNFGPQLQTIWRQTPEDRWLWTYDSSTNQFREPPDMELDIKIFKDTRLEGDWTTLTSLYISRTPECDLETNRYDCERMNRAKNLIFVRERRISGKTEYTTLYRVRDDKIEQVYHYLGQELINREDFPWYLTYKTLDEIFPWKELLNNELEPRAAVFWPERMHVYYVKKPGPRELFFIWNNISDIEWYRKMNRIEINIDSDELVGLFHWNGLVFAVGHTKADQVSRVYQLVHEEENPVLIPYNKTLRQFFGCPLKKPKEAKPMMGSRPYRPDNAKMSVRPDSFDRRVPTADNVSAVVDDNNRNEGKSHSNTNNMSPVLVIVIVIVVVVITVLLLTFLIAFFHPLHSNDSHKSTDSRGSVASVDTHNSYDKQSVVQKPSSVKSQAKK